MFFFPRVYFQIFYLLSANDMLLSLPAFSRFEESIRTYSEYSSQLSMVHFLKLDDRTSNALASRKSCVRRQSRYLRRIPENYTKKNSSSRRQTYCTFLNSDYRSLKIIYLVCFSTQRSQELQENEIPVAESLQRSHTTRNFNQMDNKRERITKS